MGYFAALATVAVSALSAFSGEGFRWRIDEVNEIMRPDVAGAAYVGGIAWVTNDTYLAVTDRKSVIWEMTLPYNPQTGRILSCGLKHLCEPEMAVDVEAIAFDRIDGSVWLADERVVTIRQYSFVSGRALPGRVDIPESFKGFRTNFGFESLSMGKDGLSMWTCTEEALKTDGPRATRKDGTDIRLTQFRRNSSNDPWRIFGQWVYHTDSVAGGPWYNEENKDLSRSGISELCVLEDGTVLVLEREFSVVLFPRLRCRIYETDMSSAKNVISRKNLVGLNDADRVRKKLLYENTGFSMYEGMCLGPRLEDGSRMLVLVSDADRKSFRSVLSLRLSPL